jgi:hypothetical protein
MRRVEHKREGRKSIGAVGRDFVLSGDDEPFCEDKTFLLPNRGEEE